MEISTKFHISLPVMDQRYNEKQKEHKFYHYHYMFLQFDLQLKRPNK